MFKKILIASAALAALSVGANAATVACNPAVQNWVNGSNTTCTVVDQNSNSNDNNQNNQRLEEIVTDRNYNEVQAL